MSPAELTGLSAGQVDGLGTTWQAVTTPTTNNTTERKGFNLPNVELIRVKDGATGAPHQACLTQTSDPLIGSVLSWPIWRVNLNSPIFVIFVGCLNNTYDVESGGI